MAEDNEKAMADVCSDLPATVEERHEHIMNTDVAFNLNREEAQTKLYLAEARVEYLDDQLLLANAEIKAMSIRKRAEGMSSSDGLIEMEKQLIASIYDVSRLEREAKEQHEKFYGEKKILHKATRVALNTVSESEQLAMTVLETQGFTFQEQVVASEN
ncbi:hypothetical protein T440DRAFT_542261 [Plenodomus tracheiphilus IPT5]|uniref:Uncharacterized protein n=1 Tax=Plenodomus tracheiphilus IPT5 TaxID=1408161 RepID=A0A6A7BIX4_9PLEO|nr:hypothetical protein T440DRAFT_542261 [Plenodomus tracheiphilus IPT5]